MTVYVGVRACMCVSVYGWGGLLAVCVSLHFGLLGPKTSWSEVTMSSQAEHIWTQQCSPACPILEHMGSLHPDGR